LTTWTSGQAAKAARRAFSLVALRSPDSRRCEPSERAHLRSAAELRDRTPSVALSTSRLIAIVNVPVFAVAAWLLWRSLAWPLTGDAAIFHFMANQFLMGLVPYRDLADVNMPLVYGIHAAIVSIGGMSDAARSELGELGGRAGGSAHGGLGLDEPGDPGSSGTTRRTHKCAHGGRLSLSFR